MIWGAEDRIVPATHADGLPSAVALHRLDGVGHMAHMEAAGEVSRLLGAMAGD